VALLQQPHQSPQHRQLCRVWPPRRTCVNYPANHPHPQFALQEPPRLNVTQEVVRVLDEVLSLNGRASSFTHDTPLLGAIPELDSMAVVSLITSMEDNFGMVVDDNDIDGATFATVGSPVDFVSGKMAG